MSTKHHCEFLSLSESLFPGRKELFLEVKEDKI